MPARRLFAEKWHFIFPNHIARFAIVLTHHAVTFVTSKVVAAGEFANQASIGMWVRLIHFHRNRLQQVAITIDFDDSLAGRFSNHHTTITQRLARVNFDPFPLVAVGLRSIIAPHHLARLGIELSDRSRPLEHQEIAIGQNMTIMNSTPRPFPPHHAIFTDHDQTTIALQQHLMRQ